MCVFVFAGREVLGEIAQGRYAKAHQEGASAAQVVARGGRVELNCDFLPWVEHRPNWDVPYNATELGQRWHLRSRARAQFGLVGDERITPPNLGTNGGTWGAGRARARFGRG